MYNKHEIMINAWSIRRSANVSISIALKATRALVKAIKATEAVAEDITWNTKIRTNDWVEGGRDRTYIKVAVYTNAWNRKCTERTGHMDNTTGSSVTA